MTNTFKKRSVHEIMFDYNEAIGEIPMGAAWKDSITSAELAIAQHNFFYGLAREMDTLPELYNTRGVCDRWADKFLALADELDPDNQD